MKPNPRTTLRVKREVYTVAQLAEASGWHRATICRDLKAGLLSYDVQLLGRLAISRHEAETWLTNRAERVKARGW